MDKSKFGSGIIKWVDKTKKMGVIVQQDGGPDVVFDLPDLVGATEGQLVQFVKDTTTPDTPRAKNIVVLSNAPRYKKS